MSCDKVKLGHHKNVSPMLHPVTFHLKEMRCLDCGKTVKKTGDIPTTDKWAWWFNNDGRDNK